MFFNPAGNDAFILGAGFSHGISKEMPLISGLTDLILQKGGFDRWASLGNIEEIMTFLAISLPWETDVDQFQKRADFYKLTSAIRLRISGAEEKVDTTDLDNAISALIKVWHEMRLPVLTLNYDTIVETILASTCDVHYFDFFPIPLANPQSRDGVGVLGGGEKPTATIYKLHGSVNWYYSGNESFYGENIFIGPRITSPGSENMLKYLFDKVPLIVPPTLEKSTFFKNETIKSLWRQAGIALGRVERLFVVGYSLPESDLLMRYFLRENLANEKLKQVIVIDPNAAIADRFKSVVPSSVEVLPFKTTGINPLVAFAKAYALTPLSKLTGLQTSDDAG